MGDLNEKNLPTLVFMNRYGDLCFIINDGKIIGFEIKESLAPASKRD